MEIDWHARFSQQTRWTKSLREYLLSKLTIDLNSQVLEVGCGTGAVTSDFLNYHPCLLHGLDINFSHCEIATRNSDKFSVSNGDVYFLPYPSGSFDIIFCHYILLWLTSPVDALSEIKRVLKPGGHFLVFAEPDYGARIDHPSSLSVLGNLQKTSLIKQGANPLIGRQVASLVSSSGFDQINYGISGYETLAGKLPEWWESEWNVIQYDLENLIAPEELNDLKILDYQCWMDGSRVLWVPTFYLSCIKPL